MAIWHSSCAMPMHPCPPCRARCRRAITIYTWRWIMLPMGMGRTATQPVLMHRAADLRRCQRCRCWRPARYSHARYCQRPSRRLSSVSDRYANLRPAGPRTSSDLENQLRLMQAAFPRFASVHPSLILGLERGHHESLHLGTRLDAAAPHHGHATNACCLRGAQ
jgi:hypothetical protein